MRNYFVTRDISFLQIRKKKQEYISGNCNTSTVSTRSPVQNEFVYSGAVCNDRDKVCMTGYFCSNGQCLPELNIPSPDAFNPCDQLRCPQGTECDTNTG